MFKKIAVTGATAALLLTSAAGAFAFNFHHNNNGGSVTVSNRGDIDNTSVNVANTGLNYGGGSQQLRSRHHGSSNSVTTGDAAAFQTTTNVIETNAGCGCASSRGGKVSVSNKGDIDNQSWNVANTGLNWGGSVNTGNALAGQDVMNVISTGVGSSE